MAWKTETDGNVLTVSKSSAPFRYGATGFCGLIALLSISGGRLGFVVAAALAVFLWLTIPALLRLTADSGQGVVTFERRSVIGGTNWTVPMGEVVAVSAGPARTGRNSSRSWTVKLLGAHGTPRQFGPFGHRDDAQAVAQTLAEWCNTTGWRPSGSEVDVIDDALSFRDLANAEQRAIDAATPPSSLGSWVDAGSVGGAARAQWKTEAISIDQGRLLIAQSAGSGCVLPIPIGIGTVARAWGLDLGQNAPRKRIKGRAGSSWAVYATDDAAASFLSPRVVAELDSWASSFPVAAGIRVGDESDGVSPIMLLVEPEGLTIIVLGLLYGERRQLIEGFAQRLRAARAV